MRAKIMRQVIYSAFLFFVCFVCFVVKSSAAEKITYDQHVLPILAR